MFDSRIVRFTSIWLLLLLAGCSALGADENYEAGDFDAPGDLGQGGEERCVIDPTADSDGDGLLDIYEDLNQNCIVDEGETDPHNPDTDGDGLLDGDEDADGNGVWDKDRGELNPLAIDTDGNGVPDAEEPKAQVCDRKHANRVLAERRMLPEGRVLYLHADIHDAVPFGETQAVFVLGKDMKSAGIVYDSPLHVSVFGEIVQSLGEGLFAPDDDSEIYLKGAYQNVERGTVEVHMRLDNHAISLSKLKDLLSPYIPELAQDIPLEDKYQPDDMHWDVQLLGEQLDEGTRWAISWKPAGESANWFRVVRPRLVGTADKPTVRFVCENVDVRSRQNLNVYLLLDQTMASEVEPWIEILNEMKDTRTQRGATTVFYAPQPLGSPGSWASVDDEVQNVHIDALVTSFFEVPFMERVVDAIQQIPDLSDQDGQEHLVLILSGEGIEDSPDAAPELPTFPSDLENVRVVVASPTMQPFSCAWRMDGARAEAVESIVTWSNARHIGHCENSTHAVDSSVFFELAGTRWQDTERSAIPGTLWIADRATSVPAVSQYVAGQRVIRASRAEESGNTAVSFAAWFGDDR